MELQESSVSPLSNIGNKTQNWLKWKEDFIYYLKVNNYNTKSEDLKIHLLKENIGVIGQNAIELICKDHKKSINNMMTLIEKLDIYFEVPKYEIIERYNFFTRFQYKNESIDAYILDLKKKAETCNFGILTDSLIRDKVIAMIKDKVLLSKLLHMENLDLIKLITIYHEHTNNMQTKMETSKKKSTDVAKKHETKNLDNDKLKTGSTDKNINNNGKKCWKCNQTHPQRQCPAWGHKCSLCGDRNHYSNCCKLPNFLTSKKKESTSTVEAYKREHIQPSCSAVLNNFSSQPSAPEFFEGKNKLYPNANYTEIAKNKFHVNSLNFRKENIKFNDAVQENAVVLPPNPEMKTDMQSQNCRMKNYTQSPNVKNKKSAQIPDLMS